MNTTDDNPFIICKASAGAGKTFTLVREYLKMALAGPPERIAQRFRGILAITFTNKAANEMKSRIMKELGAMADRGVDPASHTMGAVLLADLNAMPFYRQRPLTPEALQHLAASLYSAILHHYTDLSVFTIDSFMHRIVRTFAHDLGQPVGFEVMTDREALVDEVVDQLMAQAGTAGNEDLTLLLNAFADSNMDDERSYNIEQSLAELAKLLFDEDIGRRLERLQELTFNDFREIHKAYTAANRRVEAALRRCGADMLELLAPIGVTDDDCYRKGSGFLGWFRRLSKGEVKEPNSYVVASMTGGKLASPSCSKALATELDALRPQMEQIYGRAMHLFSHDMPLCNTRSLVLANLYSTALLGRLAVLLRDYSQSNELLHLSEFNRMINSIVEDDNNPAPFIFERLGNRYHHFLIDEFQDTSIMQWHNLVPLLENGISTRAASLVVGDAKQAIYRFRQGDVRQFVRLPHVDGMHHHGATLDLRGNYRFQPLGSNFRTASTVVEFNNGFFSWLVRNRFADNQLAKEIYIGTDADGNLRAEGDEELRQRVERAAEGFVGVSFMPSNDSDAPFAEVLAIIQRMVGECGYRYGDIMVLARDNRKLAQLSAFLTANSDVPQTSRQSFLLRSSDAVMAIVAALRHLRNRRDRVAAVDLLQRLSALGIVDGGNSSQWLMDGGRDFDLAAILHQHGHGIDFRPDYLSALDLYDCCEELVRQLRLDGVDIPYVASLLNAVAAFEARHRQQVGDFLEWFDEHDGLSAASSDQLDAVRLLTIHKAKGLEAPVVICMLLPQNEKQPRMWVDLPEGLADGCPRLPMAYVQFRKEMKTSIDTQRDAEMALNRVDDLNILYVALTRPREQLHVVCMQPGNSDGYANMLHDYLADRIDADGRVAIGTEHCHAAAEGSGTGGDTVGLQRLSFSDWSERVSIASPAERAATPLLEDRVRFGIYAHELLSDIAHAADLDAAVARFARKYRLDDGELDGLRQIAQMAVSHPTTARFFSPEYRAVRELSFVDGGELGRPDRVVFADGETWIVDFKTGKPTAANEEQVRAYCRAVAAMGYPAVSGYLLYLRPDGLDLVEVLK